MPLRMRGRVFGGPAGAVGVMVAIPWTVVLSLSGGTGYSSGGRHRPTEGPAFSPGGHGPRPAPPDPGFIARQRYGPGRAAGAGRPRPRRPARRPEARPGRTRTAPVPQRQAARPVFDPWRRGPGGGL